MSTEPTQKPHVLVTGGAGYIGSHTVLELLRNDYEVTVVDDLSNSSAGSLDSVRKLSGKQLQFHKLNIRDSQALSDILAAGSFDAIIHFAAYKAVGESVSDPLKYYQNNVAGFSGLLETALAHDIHNVVFSSTAAVYGTPPTEHVTEETPVQPESPYGWSKYMDEVILRDTCQANPSLHGVALRYFNVVGAHESGELGELPIGKPQNLLPIIVQAVTGKIPPLTVYGTDYPTPDGTCLRDYIHVVDLAKAHVAALERSVGSKEQNYAVYNLGTGKPTSVLEFIKTFEMVNAQKVPYSLGPRRAGDPVSYFADPTKAQHELGWHTTKSVEDAVRDTWNWQTKNPDGYRTPSAT